MKSAGVVRQWPGVVLLCLLIGVGALEFYGKVFERGVGHYLKWQNHKRPQLGRIWERDREALVAQAKIKSIRTGLDLKHNSAESLKTFNDRHAKRALNSRTVFMILSDGYDTGAPDVLAGELKRLGAEAGAALRARKAAGGRIQRLVAFR